MDDDKFLKLLYRQVHDIDAIWSETIEKIDDLTYDQYKILTTLASVQQIGENGSLASGLERLEESLPFKKNFRIGPKAILGKDTPGRKKGKDIIQNKDKLYASVISFMKKGYTQTAACEKAGMSETTFKRYRSKNSGL